jgi:hypothetical protein
LTLEIDEITLTIDTALSCGLIINELVSNALKYAFPNNRSGGIRVSLRSSLDKHFILIVKDNGVGFPPDWDLNSANSLGIELVNVLVQQLQGTIELERSTGSKFQISFSESLD